MTSEHWQRIEQLFYEAAELEATVRPAFLAWACRDDEEKKAVEALLAADEKARSFIEAPAVEFAGSLLPNAGTIIGRRLGAYRIEREIGRSGMGAVYLARRADRQFDQQVAIKLIRLLYKPYRKARPMRKPKNCPKSLGESTPNPSLSERVAPR